MIYSFDIDEKSLFRGVKNDYKKGQTATVHTLLNQAKDEKKWRTSIYEFLNGYSSKSIDSLPDVLMDKCLSKTTSKAESKLVYFYVFSKFSLDGIPFDADASFAMYVKEEISPTIIKRNGSIADNTHYGRQKLHYPISLFYQADGFNIDNKLVLNKILAVNGGFAYVVNGFDIDTETETLNFRTTIIGLEGVLLSNVFKRQKGIGVKLLIDGINLDKGVFVTSTNEFLSDNENKMFFATLEKIQQTSRNNGKIGEEYVLDNIERIIGIKPDQKVYVSEKYPQSPYDIECIINGRKLYIEVKSTEQDKKTFYMSRGERRFMDKYDEFYLLVLVTNVKSNNKKSFKYKRKDIMNENKMMQEHQSIKFIVK